MCKSSKPDSSESYMLKVRKQSSIAQDRNFVTSVHKAQEEEALVNRNSDAASAHKAQKADASVHHKETKSRHTLTSNANSEQYPLNIRPACLGTTDHSSDIRYRHTAAAPGNQ